MSVNSLSSSSGGVPAMKENEMTIHKLPDEMLALLFKFVLPESFAQFREVCKSWNGIFEKHSSFILQPGALPHFIWKKLPQKSTTNQKYVAAFKRWQEFKTMTLEADSAAKNALGDKQFLIVYSQPFPQDYSAYIFTLIHNKLKGTFRNYKDLMVLKESVVSEGYKQRIQNGS